MEQRHPLVKWIILLCALLILVVAFQIVILLRTNKIAAEYKLLTGRPTAAGQIQPARVRQDPHVPPAAPVPATAHLHADDWAKQMDAALNDAREMFDYMNMMFAGPVGHMRRIDPFSHFDDGWDRLMTSPTLDMREHGDNYVVLFNLPTLSPSNVTVTLDGRMLTICSTDSERIGRTAHTSAFETRVRIPGPVGDLQQANASVSNGVLRIIIPKGSPSLLPSDQLVKLL